MSSPQHFDGLKEDKITWYSNAPQKRRYTWRGLEEDEITWYSNSFQNQREIVKGLEEDKITWFSNQKRCSECCTVGLADVKLHGAQTNKSAYLRKMAVQKKMKLHGTQTDECRDGARGLETEEIAGFSNIEKEPQRCKEAKLHDAQTLHPLKITNVQVQKKIKLHSSQTEMVHLYYATNTKKLQGTQTPHDP